MKKFYLLMALLITSTFCCAQINRVFWGVTLGQSTKQQVKNVLDRKGYTVKTEPDGSLCVNVNNVSFGGAYWTYVSFSFVDDKLYQVWFQNNEVQSPVKIDNTYIKIKASLDKKYASFINRVQPAEGTEKVSDYTDTKTYISLRLNTYHNIRYISLSYEDLNSYDSKIKNENDEL